MSYSVEGGAMAGRRREKKPRGGVVLTAFSKQDSMDTYLHEWRSIRESRLLVPGDDESSDEGDPDAIWLENAGFGTYVDKLQSGDAVDDTSEVFFQTSALPKAHAAVVRRRMNTFRSTLRSKQQNGSDRSDVREVFHSKRANAMAPTSLGGRGQSPSPKTSPAISPRSSPSPSPTTVTLHSSPAKHSTHPTRHNRILAVGGGEGSALPPSHSSLVSPSSSSSSHRMRSVRVDSIHHPLPHASESSAEISRASPDRAFPPSSSSSSSSTGQVGFTRSVSSGQTGFARPPPPSSSSSPSFTQSVEATTQTRTLLPPAVLPGHTDSARLLGNSVATASPPLLARSSEVLLRPAREQTDRRATPPPPDRKSGSSIGSRHSNRSSDSPGAEEFKLHFGSPAHMMTSNGSPELPNFMIMPDALGITQLADLASEDLEKVRSVALLELTVTFEDHNIPLRPRRPHRSKNVSDNAIFGVPLSVLLQNDRRRNPNIQIPLIIEEMLFYLEENGLSEEGILRVPGSQARVTALTQELEGGVSLTGGGAYFAGKKPSDISTLLKQFLRALPSPLLTKEYLPAFASIADLEDLKEQVRTLNLLVLLLPDLHQTVLKRLLEFLERVMLHCEQNKMDLMNVSMVMAPNLFVSLPTRHSLDDVTMAAKTSHVVRLLVKYHNLLWTVPGEMLRQVRYLNEAEVKRLSQRSVQKALKQMQQQPSRRLLEAADHYIVRVKAPLFTRVCMAVDITDGVTAGDIVRKMQKKSKLNKDAVRKQFPTGPYSVTPDPPVSWGNPLPSDLRTRHSVPNILEQSRPFTLPLPPPSSSSSQQHSRSALSTPTTAVGDFPRLEGSPVEEGGVSGHALSPAGGGEELDLEAAGEQFLYEVGGNIGQRRLNHDTDMHVLYSINPNAAWVIKPRDCPDLV